MPQGIEVLNGLKQTIPEIRLLIVMGSPSLSRLREAISMGVQEILYTPLEPGELETKVTKVAKATKRNLKEALAL